MPHRAILASVAAAFVAFSCAPVRLGFAEREDVSDPYNQRVRPAPQAPRDLPRAQDLLVVSVRSAWVATGDASLGALRTAEISGGRLDGAGVWAANGWLLLALDAVRTREFEDRTGLGAQTEHRILVRPGETVRILARGGMSGVRPIVLRSEGGSSHVEEDVASWGLDVGVWPGGPQAVEVVLLPVLGVHAEGEPQPRSLEVLRASAWLRFGSGLWLTPADEPADGLASQLATEGGRVLVLRLQVEPAVDRNR